jgi:hypothetical protein
MKERLSGAVDTARPYVDQIAHDEEFKEHVKNAYDSGQRVWAEMFGDRGATGKALKFARDKDLHEEVRNAVEELRMAGGRLQAQESHTTRNILLLLTGLVLGALFNPWTGPETRKWVKDRALGPEEPFEYQPPQPNQAA